MPVSTASGQQQAGQLRQRVQAKLEKLHAAAEFPGATVGFVLADGSSLKKDPDRAWQPKVATAVQFNTDAGRRMRKGTPACIADFARVIFSEAGSEPQREARGGQRLAPPESLKCSRDHLTSFTGKVTAYQRRPGRIFLRLRTDEETTESFTLRFSPKDDPAKWFLLKREPFTQRDWTLIESRPSQLRPGMRATVWVCDDGSKPVVDWQPPEK
ncbi:MAG TPA: hypothetical protein VNQ79_00985 [Blastocatellia bacterium]|nr:hypothetical protein [Blastocatellia bacterium]